MFHSEVKALMVITVLLQNTFQMCYMGLSFAVEMQFGNGVFILEIWLSYTYRYKRVR